MSARNVFKRSIVQEKQRQIDFSGFNVSILKMLYFFFLQIREKVKQFRKFARTLFQPELSIMQSKCLDCGMCRTEGMNPFQARHHRRHIPIGCLREIKENNCQLIGCLIFHGPLMHRVFVLPLSAGIIMGQSLTHLSKTGFFTEKGSCCFGSQQERADCSEASASFQSCAK